MSPACQSVTTLGLSNVQYQMHALRSLPRETITTLIVAETQTSLDVTPGLTPVVQKYLATLPSLRHTQVTYIGDGSTFMDADLLASVKLQALRIALSPHFSYSTGLLRGLAMLEVQHSVVEEIVGVLRNQACNLPLLRILSIFEDYDGYYQEDEYCRHLPQMIALCPNLAELVCCELDLADMPPLLASLPSTPITLIATVSWMSTLVALLQGLNTLAAQGTSLALYLRVAIEEDALHEYFWDDINEYGLSFWFGSDPFENFDEDDPSVDYDDVCEDAERGVQHAFGQVYMKSLDYHGIRYDVADWPSNFGCEGQHPRQRKM
jgi:hypothetical protein